MLTQIQPQIGYLLATSSGPFSRDRLGPALTEIFAASSKHQLYKILIDGRTLEGDIPVMARYDLGELMAKLQQNPVRIAIVMKDDHILPDRFGENVANNRGVATKVTSDLAEALEWLHRGS